MTRTLILGCAAIALSVGCGTANAQTKFVVSVGGDAYFAFGGISQKNDQNLRGTEFTNRFRLNVIPKATADNGLEYGARIRIRTVNGNRTTDADKAFIFAEGPIGRFEAGLNHGPGDAGGSLGPIDDFSANGLGSGIDTPFAPFDNFLNGSGVGTVVGNSQLFNEPRGIGSSTTATRINYYTPRFAGFQLNASYAPRIDSANTDVSRRKFTTANGYYVYDDLYELGLTYTGEFGDWTVDGDFTYTGGTTRKASAANNYKDLSSYKFGGDVKWKNIKLGGSYLNGGKSGFDNTISPILVQDQELYNIGIAYIADAFAVGFTYTGAKDSASATVGGGAGRVNFDIFTVGGTYTIAPGLSVSAEYDRVNMNSKVKTVLPNDNADVFILRTAVAF